MEEISMDFLASIDWNIVGLIVVFAISVYGVYEWKSFQEMAQSLFLIAEKAMIDLVIASGPEAMEKVANALYDMLPIKVRLVIRAAALLIGTTPRALTKALCQYIYDRLKSKYQDTLRLWRIVPTKLESEGMR